MKTLDVAALCVLSACVGGVLVHFAEPKMEDLVYGPAEPMVITRDVDLNACPDRAEGGLRAGTHVEVRRHGPFNYISMRALVSDPDLPLRLASSAELPKTHLAPKCAKYSSANPTTDDQKVLLGE